MFFVKMIRGVKIVLRRTYYKYIVYFSSIPYESVTDHFLSPLPFWLSYAGLRLWLSCFVMGCTRQGEAFFFLRRVKNPHTKKGPVHKKKKINVYTTRKSYCVYLFFF